MKYNLEEITCPRVIIDIYLLKIFLKVLDFYFNNAKQNWKLSEYNLSHPKKMIKIYESKN
jgi:hypothetical protein